VIDDDEHAAVDGMTGRGNRSTRRKPDPMQVYPSQMQQETINSGKN
jgi:hypothetical protein